MRKLTTPLFIKHLKILGNKPQRLNDSEIELHCKLFQLGFAELMKVSYNTIADSKSPIDTMNSVIEQVRNRNK